MRETISRAAMDQFLGILTAPVLSVATKMQMATAYVENLDINEGDPPETADTRPPRHPAFSIACTVFWTELHQAFAKDGVELHKTCSPAVARVIMNSIQDQLSLIVAMGKS